MGSVVFPYIKKMASDNPANLKPHPPQQIYLAMKPTEKAESAAGKEKCLITTRDAFDLFAINFFY